MDSALDFHSAKALLEWQIELGATEAICDAPVNRFELAPALPRKTPAVAPDGSQPVTSVDPVDPVAAAQLAADAAESLEELAAAIAAFDLCELKRGARTTVFADGIPEARVMIIGEAPGREEDQQGRPFVGRAGQMLDRMFAAIHLARDATMADSGIYLTNIVPWRPPQNRDPEAQEIAMMLPFVQRHIQLVAPDILVLMGNVACQALLGRKGITRMRGAWTQVQNLPAMPMFHPAYLLRNPAAKREAWADLLMVQSRLRAGV